MEARTLITAAIATMGLFILLLVVQTTWRAAEDYRYAEDSAITSEISMHMVRASDYRALERGFTSGALAAQTTPEIQFMEIIRQMRRSGDEHQNKALGLIQGLTDKRPEHFPLKLGLKHELGHVKSLREARELVDRQLGGERQLITPQQWFNRMTKVIVLGADLRDAITSTVLTAPLISHSYWAIRHWTWRISENAGRERAIIAIHIADNKPISGKTLEQLGGYRTVVEHELEMLSSAKVQSSAHPDFVRAIEEMERVFTGEYELVRQSIYRSAQDASYSISRDQWLDQATTAIDSVLNVSNVCSQMISEAVVSTQKNRLRIMLLYLFLLVVTVVLVILAIRKVRQTANSLVQSKAIAETTASKLQKEVDERRRLEHSLRSSQEGFKSLVMRNPTGIIVVDPVGGTLFSNSAAQHMLERTETELNTELIKLPLLIGYNYEVDITGDDGRPGEAEVNITKTVWDDSSAVLVLLHDISERKAAQNEIERLSYYDTLTELPNRLLFHDRVKHGVARAKRAETMLALLFVDIDGFKVINNTLGNLVGDELLRQVAHRLCDCVRDEDTVARVGGDEFAILLEDLRHLDHINDISQNIQVSLSEQFNLLEHKQYLSVCIGSSAFPIDEEDAGSLIRQAHTAKFHAQEEGRGKCKSYIADMGLRFSKRLQLENRLRKGLENDEFVLHYQCQVSLRDNRIIGVEALLRWQDPERGLIFPTEFIPILEDTGLIAPVGEWVLRTACEQNKQWQDAGLDPIVMAVNVSPVQFGLHRIMDVVTDVLDNTGLSPQFLELEITESALMNKPAGCALVLKELKELGVKAAIDDFGTGYSSLSYLKKFPVDKLKIDRSFVMDLPHDANDVLITKAILGLGSSLQLRVLAEGVETEEQLSYLQQHGCEEVQGNFFSLPVPANELTKLLEIQSRKEVAVGPASVHLG